MKKTLGLGLVCLMLSNTAVASKARLLALGMDELDNEGSYYIDDVRNIFLNVANINNYANTMMLEWGDKGTMLGKATLGLDSNNTTDTNTNPKAQGGFLMQSGSYVWGAYLGNESNTSSMLKAVGSAKGSVNAPAPLRSELLVSSDNQIDLFLGRESNGVKWGANIVYTKSKESGQSYEDDGYAVRLGAITSQWNAFANISLGSTSKGTYDGSKTHEFDGQLGFHVGGAYNLTDSGKLYTYIKRFDWEQNDSDAAVVNRNVDGGFTTYSIGYGHQLETDSGTLFSNLSLVVKNIQVKYDNKAEANNTEIPLTIGYEADATSWLSLRGSITQNIYGTRKNNNYNSLNLIAKGLAENVFGNDTANKKVSIKDSTDVRAGASLNLGKLVVDGLIGTTTNGNLNFNEVMSRVGVTYSF